MPTKTQIRAALAESQVRWAIRFAEPTPDTVPHLGPGNCALCVLFRYTGIQSAALCKKCPVALASGKPSCGNTPYAAAEDALDRWRTALDESHQARVDAINAGVPTLDVGQQAKVIAATRKVERAKRSWRKACGKELAFLLSLEVP